jgi:aerobic C4-dicarboxylate transport protein
VNRLAERNAAGLAADTVAPSHRKPFYKQIWLWVLVAMVAGVLLGAVDPKLGVAMAPLGNGFIKLISMLVGPLVFCTIVSGMARMANMGRIGHIMFKVIVLFEAMSLTALLIAVAAVMILKPGVGMNISAHALNGSAVHDYAVKGANIGPVSFLFNIIPDSFTGAFVDHNLLQVVFLAMLAGFAILPLGEKAAPFTAALEGFLNIIYGMVRIIMWAAPFGAFGALAFGIGKFGLASMIPLGKFIGEFYAVNIVVFLTLGLSFGAACGFNFFKYIRYFRSEILLTIATTSSEVVLPQIIAKMEKLGGKPGLAGLVVPAGYSFNPIGTGPYLVMVICFLAQAMNIHVGIGDLVELMLIATLTSRASGGVAGSAFIILTGTMGMWGLVPVAGATLFLGIHRLLAQAFVPTFAFANPLAVLGVSRWEGELDVAELNRVLDQREAA